MYLSCLFTLQQPNESSSAEATAESAASPTFDYIPIVAVDYANVLLGLSKSTFSAAIEDEGAAT